MIIVNYRNIDYNIINLLNTLKVPYLYLQFIFKNNSKLNFIKKLNLY